MSSNVRLSPKSKHQNHAASLRQTIAFLDQEIAATQAAIDEHIDDHPGLRKQRDLLVSIPGIGETTAAKLLGEVLERQALQGRAPTRRFRRPRAPFARVRHEREEEGEALEGRRAAAQESVLLPGHLRAQTQPVDQSTG